MAPQGAGGLAKPFTFSWGCLRTGGLPATGGQRLGLSSAKDSVRLTANPDSLHNAKMMASLYMSNPVNINIDYYN